MAPFALVFLILRQSTHKSTSGMSKRGPIHRPPVHAWHLTKIFCYLVEHACRDIIVRLPTQNNDLSPCGFLQGL